MTIITHYYVLKTPELADVHLPSDKSFPCLGVRASLISSGSCKLAGPILAVEKEHVLAATKELVQAWLRLLGRTLAGTR